MPKLLIPTDVFDNTGKLKSSVLPDGLNGNPDWSNVQNKPTSFNPAAHDHNGIYYTKEQVDDISFQAGGGLTRSQVNELISKEGHIYAVDFGVKNSDLHPEIQGAVGTGYPLSVYYSTLSAAQVDFPTAAFLTDIVDGLAIQNAIDFAIYGGSGSKIPVIKMPSGLLYLSRPLQGSYGITFTDFEGQSRSYASFVLIGTKASAGKGNASTEKGTVLMPLYKGNMVLNLQGVNKVAVRDFSISGTNTSIPANGGLYGYNAQIQANYISPNNSSTDGVPSGFTVEKYRYAPPAGITIDAYSSHPSQYDAPPSGVTYVSYDDIIINPAYFSEGQRTQWWKNVSTDVWIENVDIRNFIAGIVVHPNGSDGNGDFVRIKKCIVFNCMVGFAPCQSQARLSTIDDSQFDANWVTVACDMFGKKQGRFMGGTNTHVSGHKILSISNMSVNGPLQLDRWYGESIGRIGDCGYEIANTCEPFLNNCDFNFGHQESGWVPLNIYSGYSIVINGGRLYGRNIDLSTEIKPTINNVKLEVVPSGAFNGVYNFDTDVNSNGFYYKAFFNHPISTGTAKKINAIGNNIVQVHINKYVLNQNTFGSNAYHYPEQPGNSPGFTGRHGDYNWSSGSLTIGNAYTSFSSGHLVFNVANIGLARDIQKALMNEGDIIAIPTYGFKFMIYNRSGNTCDAVLLNGFIEGYSSYLVGDGTLAAMQALLSDTDINWTWFNNNWYDAAPPLEYGRQWAIKGTATLGSPNLTVVDYADDIENGSRAAAYTHFQLGTALHYYGYSFSPKVPTTEMETAVVLGTSSGTVTMDRNSPFSGTVLLYNKYPYDLR